MVDQSFPGEKREIDVLSGTARFANVQSPPVTVTFPLPPPWML